MKIGILSRNAKLYSTQRLAEAAKRREHEVLIINPLKCYMNITSKKPTVLYKKQVLSNFDAIIPRIGASVTFYASAVLRQFELQHTFCLNSSLAIGRSRDKLRALQILSQHGVGLPVTGFAHSTKMTDDLIKIAKGAPLVVKLLFGSQGKGVVLCETKKAATSVIEAFREIDAEFLVQEFIKESGGTDLRCFVVGNEVVAAMIRTAKDGEFRSNLHKGGTAVPTELTAKERETAIVAAKAMGLNVAGVDILRSKRGPLVLEVNSSPGLEGIEKATGLDIATMIIKYIEANQSRKNVVSF